MGKPELLSFKQQEPGPEQEQEKAKAAAEQAKAQQEKASVFTIELLSETGDPIQPADSGCYRPEHPQARRLSISINPTDTEPTEEQMELCRGLTDYEHAIREIYLDGAQGAQPDVSKFKEKFVAVFGLSQLILEGHVTEPIGVDGKKKKHAGKTLPLNVAKKEIALLHQDLIDDEAPRVKNNNFLSLQREAMKLAVFFVLAYVVLRMLVPTEVGTTLSHQFSIQPLTASNFMLLWIGAFVGVCLSYAVRTQKFTLTDLTRPSADYFWPQNRLLLAGAFATVLAYLAMVGLGEVTIGEISLKGIASNPMVALTAGAIMGLFEYKLTGLVAGRAGALLPGDTK